MKKNKPTVERRTVKLESKPELRCEKISSLERAAFIVTKTGFVSHRGSLAQHSRYFDLYKDNAFEKH